MDELKPATDALGEGVDPVVGQPADLSRRAFLVDAAKVFGLVVAAVKAGPVFAEDASEAVDEAPPVGSRLEATKKAAFPAWTFPEDYNIPQPALLSPDFLAQHGLTSKEDPVGPFIRTTDIQHLVPQDEIPMGTPIGVEQEMKFMFIVFVPKGQNGTVRVRWECDGEVYKNTEGKHPRHIAPHDIGDASSSNGYRLHDTARFPKAGNWTATVTMRVQKEGQEGEEIIKLGSFDVPVE